MNLKERVQELCKQKNVTAQQVKLDLGFGKSYINKLNTNVPNASKMRLIADYFSISVDYLLGRDEQKNQPTPMYEDELDEMEKLLMQYVKDLTREQKQMLLAQMQVMKEQQRESLPVSVH